MQFFRFYTLAERKIRKNGLIFAHFAHKVIENFNCLHEESSCLRLVMPGKHVYDCHFQQTAKKAQDIK